MRVLVTGAGGFIGSHVVRALRAAGHDVQAILRPGGSRVRLTGLDDRITAVELDLADDAGVRRALARLEPEVVIHLAWYAESGRYLHAVEENLASLRESVALLSSLAGSGCRRVVLGGTCLESASNPTRSAYAAAKRAMHSALDALADSTVSGVCGHVFYLYGPAEDRRRVLPSVILPLLQGNAVKTTEARQPRDYLHVGDVASAFRYLAEASIVGSADICSGTVVLLRDVLVAAAQEVGRPDLLQLGALGPSDDPGFSAAGDPTILRRLGWTPRYDLGSGIADAVLWWREQEIAG